MCQGDFVSILSVGGDCGHIHSTHFCRNFYNRWKLIFVPFFFLRLWPACIGLLSGCVQYASEGSWGLTCNREKQKIGIENRSSRDIIVYRTNQHHHGFKGSVGFFLQHAQMYSRVMHLLSDIIIGRRQEEHQIKYRQRTRKGSQGASKKDTF